MARSSRAGEVGNVPVYRDSLCADSLESRFLTRRIDTRGRYRLLRSNLRHPAHQFWPDDIGLLDAIASCEGRLTGH
jgi:hypothetical protein